MSTVIEIGMDVHANSFSLCAMEVPVGRGGKPRILAEGQVPADYRKVLKWAEENILVHASPDNPIEVEFGYEAGCLGYSLRNQLTEAGVPCIILAPTTMMVTKGPRIKTDRRDAQQIAHCLATGSYSPVHVLDETDEGVRAYMRMREDTRNLLKTVKQQINAQCMALGHHYEGTKWTQAHLAWLKNLKISDHYQELALRERLVHYHALTADIERYDKEIEQQIAVMPRYKENVRMLGCLLSMTALNAVAVLCEIGDFTRFQKANIFGAYLGLAPGEHSSGTHTCRTGISKAGNSTLRRKLVLAAQSICRGRVGEKPKALKERQMGNPPEIIAYADHANKRMRRKYYRLIANGKNRNVAVTAVARELACFIWGIMTGNTQLKAA